MGANFADLLKTDRIILLDGAMGTQLSARGAIAGGQANIEAGEVVSAIHREYIECGCDAITTNTLTMNRIYIETHNVGVSVEEVNRIGAELAMRAGGDGVFVLGNISSTGQLLEPYGTFTTDQFAETFKEQASILAQAGVDGFIIETIIDLREAVCALRGCRAVSDLPVLVSMSFATDDKGGRTVMGDSVADCAGRLAGEGAGAIGANCGDLDPYQTAVVVGLFREATALPLLAQPNAGKPKLVGDKTVFDMGADEFAAGIEGCAAAGARIVGGCCGTTPRHIRAVAERLGRR